MAYVRLETRFPTHPKIAGLSDAAFRLHVAALCYAGEHLTDGLIRADVVPLLHPERTGRKAALSELTGRLLWIPLDGGAGWEIHDYLDWNRSRETVDNLRDAGRRAARRRWDT